MIWWKLIMQEKIEALKQLISRLHTDSAQQQLAQLHSDPDLPNLLIHVLSREQNPHIIKQCALIFRDWSKDYFPPNPPESQNLLQRIISLFDSFYLQFSDKLVLAEIVENCISQRVGCEQFGVLSHQRFLISQLKNAPARNPSQIAEIAKILFCLLALNRNMESKSYLVFLFSQTKHLYTFFW